MDQFFFSNVFEDGDGLVKLKDDSLLVRRYINCCDLFLFKIHMVPSVLVRFFCFLLFVELIQSLQVFVEVLSLRDSWNLILWNYVLQAESHPEHLLVNIELFVLLLSPQLNSCFDEFEIGLILKVLECRESWNEGFLVSLLTDYC